MYAIVQQGGHQYRLSPGDRFLVDRLPAEIGSTITLEPVLLLGHGDGATPGLDAARGARVAAVVVGHRLGRKLRVYKYKPKKRYRRTHGHRSQYTELRVEAVLTGGQSPPAAAPASAEPESAVEEKPKRRRAPKAAAPTPVEAVETVEGAEAAQGGARGHREAMPSSERGESPREDPSGAAEAAAEKEE